MIDTTGKCSVCGQTVGIDTIHTCSPQAPRPRVSEHTDAARLEALRDSMRPRVEEEAAWLTMDEHEAQGYDLPKRAVGSKSHWLAMADRWTVEAVAQRAECARLTAEVARLTRRVEELGSEVCGPVPGDDPVRPIGEWLTSMIDADHWPTAERHLNQLRASFAALSLPTPAPEATE